MNLTSPSQVKAWCIENGFHPNKTLGQNFLIDRNALVAIVDAGLEFAGGGAKGEGEAAGISVLEVGPGLGVLTEELLARGCEVVAIEKDPVLAGRLAREARPRLSVVAGDALEVLADPGRFNLASPDSPPGSVRAFDCMVSNLPYQAGTRILLELVQTRAIPVMTALVQTEVAERLAAGPGTKTRSLAGVWTQLDYDVEIVRKVSASCFWPRPEIGSSVVRLVRHDRNAEFPEAARRLFRQITKRAFEHRRKQLGSVFRDMIQSTARAEELSNEDWTTLTKGLMPHEDA